jgi:PmbA protein
MPVTNQQTELAQWASDQAIRAGAKEARASVSRTRFTNLEYRERKIETLEQSVESGLSLTLYIDGHYSSHRTSDLRRDALQKFIRDAVAMTNYLTPDEYRSLPDPRYYENRRDVDLELNDPDYAKVAPDDRHRVAREIEAAALDAGGDKIISVTAGYYDNTSETATVASNGFVGSRESTAFWCGAEATAKDEGDKRPEEWWWEGRRRRGEISDPASIGRRTVERALRRVGARKIPTETLPVIVENRAVGRLLRFFGSALDGRNLQQRSSFLEGKQGQKIGSEILTVYDDPFVPSGQGSRLFDSEGISAKRMPIVEKGVLRNFYIDSYYAKKLGMEATTGSPSNGVFEAGTKSPEEWMRELGRGLFVTGFLGGNSNSSTGDFSTGIQGFLFDASGLGDPVTELNLAGNHLEFWNHLIGLGNDPYEFSSIRTPSFVFDKLLIAGA